MKKLFIVIEGPSGSGKSTLTKNLKVNFEKYGQEVIITKEPTSNFNPNNENTKQGVELADLYLADRNEHVLDCIMPNLDAGKTVICDRYIPSTMVYQQIEGIPYQTTLAQSLDFPVPTLTIFLEVGIDVLTARVNERETKTRFEAESFRTKEVNVYSQIPDILNKIGWNTMVIDSEQLSVDSISEMITDLFVTKED